MKERFVILVFLLTCGLFFLSAKGQIKLKTVVPQRSIAVGESFQVQYILENADNLSDFHAPSFSGFRLVSGPNMYSGKKTTEEGRAILYKNIVFTLAAETEGQYRVEGASCLVNGKMLKSNTATVKVISPKEPDESSYFLRAGEDPYKKISRNLFLKLTVDKQNCFIGEPLVATFKLYSRLQSRSNIIKSPGFYGFSVYDMIDLEDQVQSEEKVGGLWFEVHTIRKLQLYPLEAGTFTIDPMELENKVEFSRSVVNKKTEQEITENLHDENDENNDANTEVYEMNIKSDPVVIHVKPLPSKNHIDTFAGAVGNFTITSFVKKDSLLKNEEGVFTVDINGAGNFQRVNAPVIKWPEGLETFEPSVKDTFVKQQVPLAGQRKFTYTFVSNKPGFYTLPSVSFSFFDIKSKTYTTTSTKPIKIFISAKSKKETPVAIPHEIVKPTKKSNRWLIAFGAAAAIIAAVVIIWRKRKKNLLAKENIVSTEIPMLTVEKILEPAKKALAENDKTFYEELDRSIWRYFADRLKNERTVMMKRELAAILSSKNIAPGKIASLMEIIHQCETKIYTNAAIDIDKSKLLENTQKILLSIEKPLV
jgi:LPXTG-motif cell wall-anchored protein